VVMGLRVSRKDLRSDRGCWDDLLRCDVTLC
jgi:hypothetical protein